MSVKIRLSKTGKKHQISYRIVAQDTKTKRDGRFLEIIGFYNPFNQPSEKLRFDKEKYNKWLTKGARPTQAVEKLIK
jgi:small subunit ribosomal protein S16